MTASLPHPGQRTPSGQRCWRTSAKHLASSNSSERLTRSDEGMTARAPCATAAADQPPASSQQKPHATATRSPASQHPGSQQEPSVFGRLAGYEDVNDANRLGRDPALRWIVGGRAVTHNAASTSQMGRFETEVLTQAANLSALADLSGRWIDRVHARRPVRGIVLDMDSSV